ncbi:MAG: hypothetical protein Q8R76_01240 [Candidatus Omnitrophota bacterium]|nr:hypothetical protein [Candidatus Omnitrophota bacterium]
MRKNNHRPDKIHEALELLNEAARDKREELYDRMEGQYDELRHLFNDASGNVRKSAANLKNRTEDALHEGQEKIGRFAHEKGEEVDRSVHENPWPFLGGVAVAAFVLGYRFSSRKK